ncbi:MAG: NYN domain-containing protein [Candidatus Dormibacteraeota bacterium]|jgi:predicted RNA-binding protein with PIN domain|nr:NYN domain-containing protein [Candidatus Dormibacteraeota bacterium]
MRPATLLVVDGTNVIWAWPKSRPYMLRQEFARAQTVLHAAILESRLMALHREVVLVFDGPPSPGGPTSARGTLVLHPNVGKSADDRILELIAHRGKSGGIALVTSDRALRDAARALGATTMGALELLRLLEPGRPNPQATPRPHGAASEKPSPSSRDTEAWLKRFNARS